MNKGAEKERQEFRCNKDSDPDWSDPLALLTICFFIFPPQAPSHY